MDRDGIKEYYEENYEKKNHRKGRNINLPDRLYKDFHKICIDNDRFMSAEIRIMVTQYIMDNKK